MGRGTRNTGTATSGAAMRGGLAARVQLPEQQVSVQDLMSQAYDEAMIGRAISLGDDANGIEVLAPVTADTPGHTLEGIANAVSVDQTGSDRFTVRFKDGLAAMVDLSDPDNPQIALSDGSTDKLSHLHGALAMAVARQHSLADDDADLIRLADAFADHQETLGSPNPAVTSELAAAAHAVLARGAGDVTLNPSSMSRWVDSQRQVERAAGTGLNLSPRAAQRRRARRFGDAVKDAVAQGFSFNQALRLAMFGQHQQRGQILAPSAYELESYQQAALELGGVEIPALDAEGNQEFEEERDPITGEIVIDANGQPIYTDKPKMTNTLVPNLPNWKLGEQERLMLINMQHHASIGTRAFFLAGPPGTGKTMFAKKWAELHGMPFSEFTLGEGVSVQALLGDTGMKSEIIRDEKTGEIKGVVPVTGEQQGKLLRALQQPGVSCINEAEDIAEAMLALNTALNDRVGATDSRTINTNTAEGKEIQHLVHPDHYIFVTWNPGHDDKAPAESSMDRGLVMHMKRGTPAEEAPKYAQMIRDALKFQNMVPALQDVEIEDAEVEVIARAAQKLQNAYMQNPAEFRREVGVRTMAKFGASILLEGAKNSDDGPVEMALLQLRGLLPAYPGMADDAALDMLRATLSDEYQAMIAFAKKGFEATAADAA